MARLPCSLALLLCLGGTLAQEFCTGTSYYYLNSYSYDKTAVENKPLVITGNDNIDVNVKFVITLGSTVQVTVLGQGIAPKSATTIGHSIDVIDGINLVISKTEGINSASAKPSANLLLSLAFLPVLLACFFGKHMLVLLVCLGLAFYGAHAADPCSSGIAGATVIISLPSNFAFSETTFAINNGQMECDASVGLFAPVCNQILLNPVPANALPPYDTDGNGYTLKWLTGGIWVIWDNIGTYNTMFVVTDAGVIVVDSPPTIGTAYVAAVQNVTNLPVKYIVYSHLHSDHIGAANVWDSTGADIIAHQAVHDAIARSNSPLGSGRLLPTITFNDSYTLTLGNETLQLDYHGILHSHGDIAVYSATHRVLLAVDLIASKLAPFRNLFETIYVQGFMAAHSILDTYNFDILVNGHNQLASKADISLSYALTSAVRQAAIDALYAVTTPNTGLDVNGNFNAWETFNVYLDRVAVVCVDNFREDNAQMYTQWGSLDVFIFSYCDNMVRSMRLE